MHGSSREGDIHILTSAYGVLEPGALVGRVELDLGCGKGGFALELARRNPGARVLAADVMLGRLRRLVRRVAALKIGNLTVLRVEATHLAGYILADSSVDRVHVLCPDPWPKKRHKDNRLLNSQFMGSLSRVLKPGGVFHFCSDSEEYFGSVLRIVESSGVFSALDDSLIEDIRDIRSNFESRWEDAGMAVRHAAWRRLSTIDNLRISAT